MFTSVSINITHTDVRSGKWVVQLKCYLKKKSFKFTACYLCICMFEPKKD